MSCQIGNYLAGHVPPNRKLFGGTVPPKRKLFGGTIPPNRKLFGGTVPPNSLPQIKLKKEYEATMKTSQCKLGKTIVTQAVEDLEDEIGNDISDKNAAKVKDYISKISTSEGNFSQTALWKLKNKLCPRPSDPPMAKKDAYGNLITAPSSLKELYVATYIHRLRHRKIKAEYKDLLILKNQLWARRLQNMKAPWSMNIWRKF